MINSLQVAEYSVLEMNRVLDAMRGLYDVVRLVDPEECRVLQVAEDGKIHYGKECHQVWGASRRCANCTSYQACMTHRRREKVEIYEGQKYQIESVPIYLLLEDGEREFCVMELIRIRSLEEADRRSHHEMIRDDLVYLNTHDTMTRLYNQEELYHRIRQMLLTHPEHEYQMITGNVRNFKLVNRLFGREKGNEVLIGIADILRSICTHEEVYGRLRDDHFVVFARRDKFHEETFLKHLRRIEKLIDSPIYNLQVHLGIYNVADNDMPVSAMIERADLALATIKNSRDQYIAHCTEGMMECQLEEQQVISEFEKNLNNRQFHIYLQPQVDDQEKVRGAEVLVRWMRSDGSIVQPERFLPILSHSDLIPSLDLFIWELAVKQLCDWKGTIYEDLYLSVNIDPKDFYYADVPHVLSDLCKQYGVDKKKLRVEITETALVEDVETQSHVVEKLQEVGFVVEIDDFGKGSSSLSMLKDVHADVLKIDMGFLSGTRNLRRSKVILESVIDMADQLKMEVVTEGVETREQVERLKDMGCQTFQGFYFSRPIPVEHFETMYREMIENTKNRNF